jgi:hypothetical protein
MEEFRLVIGVMPILSLNDTQKFGYPAIAGDRRRMIRLRREQMPRLWSIVHRRNVSRGLVHYLEDREVTRILGTLGKVGVSLSRVNDGLSDADVSQSSDEAIEEFVERRLRSEREFFLRNHRAADLVRKRAGGKCAVCERNVFAHYLVDVIEAPIAKEDVFQVSFGRSGWAILPLFAPPAIGRCIDGAKIRSGP